MKPYWVSWWHDLETMGPFEWHGPWWVSGHDADGRDSVCAAVVADSAEDAIAALVESYDKRPGALDVRLCSEQSVDWQPYSGRFPRADWMRWPWSGDDNQAELRGEG